MHWPLEEMILAPVAASSGLPDVWRVKTVQASIVRLVQRVTAVYSIKNESRAAWVVMRLCKGRRYTAMYDSVQH